AYDFSRDWSSDVCSSDLPRLRRFAEGLPFRLDDFQRTACKAVERGSGVLVCAPTGAGKTVVGEFAVYLALHDGRPGRRRKCFYRSEERRDGRTEASRRK